MNIVYNRHTLITSTGAITKSFFIIAADDQSCVPEATPPRSDPVFCIICTLTLEGVVILSGLIFLACLCVPSILSYVCLICSTALFFYHFVFYAVPFYSTQH